MFTLDELNQVFDNYTREEYFDCIQRWIKYEYLNEFLELAKQINNKKSVREFLIELSDKKNSWYKIDDFNDRINIFLKNY